MMDSPKKQMIQKNVDVRCPWQHERETLQTKEGEGCDYSDNDWDKMRTKMTMKWGWGSKHHGGRGVTDIIPFKKKVYDQDTHLQVDRDTVVYKRLPLLLEATHAGSRKMCQRRELIIQILCRNYKSIAAAARALLYPRVVWFTHLNIILFRIRVQ